MCCMVESDFTLAKKHFKKRDVILYTALCETEGLFEFSKAKKKSPSSLFSILCDSIISQQLSVKAASTISRRLKEKLKRFTPDTLIAARAPTFASCGISAAKTKALKELAKEVKRGLKLASLSALSSEEAISRLVVIKGIGPWTAQMFLLFGLQHPDIFAPKDLGIIRSIEFLYGSNATTEFIEKLEEVYRPFNSIACRVLWKHRDQIQKQSKK
jgi:DNA-3-methyladenine glycosylase II